MGSNLGWRVSRVQGFRIVGLGLVLRVQGLWSCRFDTGSDGNDGSSYGDDEDDDDDDDEKDL